MENREKEIDADKWADTFDTDTLPEGAIEEYDWDI